MRYSLLAAVTILSLATATLAVEPTPPWRQLYRGPEATGPNAIGLWQFLPGHEAEDASGNGHVLTLRGQSRFVPGGPFGGTLESVGADGDHDMAQGAVVKDADDLSPAGAFTLEAWFMAGPNMSQYSNVFLLDKKYYNYARDLPEANWDYCLYLPQISGDRRRLVASLGFGKDSDFISGPEIEATPGKWVHVAYTYDGAGRSRFFVNGKLMSRMDLDGRGPITPGKYDLAIGDRFGSTHTGFPGRIAQVRVSRGIVPYFAGGLAVGFGVGRTAFVRMEPNAAATVVITNDSPVRIPDVMARVDLAGVRKDWNLTGIDGNGKLTFSVPVNTALRPDDYPLSVTISAGMGGKPYLVKAETSISIVPRPLPNQMPVVLWGSGDTERLKAIGFTHMLTSLDVDQQAWNTGKPVSALGPDQAEEQGRQLDDLLRAGLHGLVYLRPGSWVTADEQRHATYGRVDREGRVREGDNVCGNFPEVQQLAYNVGASAAQTLGQYPALAGSLVHSEVRDASELCFHQRDRDLFRQASGYDIPAEALSKGGVNYGRIANFPLNRVVADDDRLLTFYRWFWKSGDGWNGLHSAVSRGLHSTGRRDLWSFFDPAVRVPDVWGSGGDVDVISQWTYSYADPIKIGQAADELFAMAEGTPGQQVMKMTQVIWYRSQTAPEPPADKSKWTEWEKAQPTGAFITIAPDHMREAFWSKISRPVRGIMYHGWQSLVDTGSTTGYVFTNSETQQVLTGLTHEVVGPLGPSLLQIPDRKADVAVLQSFSSQIFAGRGTYGWSGSWEADMHLVLQWAHLQPRIVFDETVTRDGLDDIRVLVMPFCDVLTASVVRRIKDFQRQGGILVGDEYLCPAIVPDIVIPRYKRTGKPDVDKAALQALAADLRRELDAFYTRYGDAPDPDAVLRFRQYGSTDYLFALNDRREFGDYVGQHGLVMEKGLPLTTTISVRRPAAFAYNLVTHRAVPVTAAADGIQLTADLGPGAGRLFMLTNQPIAAVKLQAPQAAGPGEAVDLTVSVRDNHGATMAAVVPVQLEITDSRGRPAEYSGYYGARDGQFTVRIRLAANDAPGGWTIRATELASGLSAERKLTVRHPGSP